MFKEKSETSLVLQNKKGLDVRSPACYKVVLHCICRLSSHGEQEDSLDSKTLPAFGQHLAQVG